MKDFFEAFKKGSHVMKKVNVMMIIAAAGVLLIVLANLFSPGNTPDEPAQTGSSNTPRNAAGNPGSSNDISTMEKNTARDLEEILSQIDGVGDVRVTVNLASTAEKDFAINTNVDSKSTQEHDQRGGNRTVTETNEQDQMVLVRVNQGSKEDPVVVKEMKPEVKGVIVLADGVSDPFVKANVMKAAQVYLDIPLYRVIVLQKESR